MPPLVAVALLLPAAPVPKPNLAEQRAAFGTVPESDDFAATFDNGRLTLASKGKARPDFFADGKLLAYRTERPAKGDFTVEVTLLTAARPTQDTPKHDARVLSGLYIRHATETVRLGKFVRVATTDDGLRTVHDESLWLQQDGSGTRLADGKHDEPIRVRLVRSGTNVMLWRRDKDEWAKLSTVETKWGDDVTVGVFLLPEVNQKVEATFADFRLSAK